MVIYFRLMNQTANVAKHVLPCPGILSRPASSCHANMGAAVPVFDPWLNHTSAPKPELKAEPGLELEPGFKPWPKPDLEPEPEPRCWLPLGGWRAKGNGDGIAVGDGVVSLAMVLRCGAVMLVMTRRQC